MRIPITVIIPSYNAVNLLAKNLPHVFNAIEEGDAVMVVDDASTDATDIWMINTYKLQKVAELPQLSLPKNYFPKISDDTTDLYVATVSVKGRSFSLSLVVNKENARFAATSNKGVALAQHPWVFLLNNDVVLHKDCLSELRQSVLETKNIFAVGCIEYEDSQKKEPSGKNKLWFERGLFLHSRADDFEAGETAWVSGGSGLFSRAKWLELNGFDKNFYPAYWEDIDISFRAREKGWRVLFNPKAIVFHKHETTNATVLGLASIKKLSWRHAQYFTWKHASFFQKLQFVLWQPYWLLKRYLAR